MTSNKVYSTLWAILCCVIFIFVIILVGQVWLRISFPWDVFVWSESPFLTNLLKLHNHLPIYGPPADANSFVYAPGLEYLCYAILRPFGLELDIRYCRLIPVALGVMAAICGAWLTSKVARPPANRRAGRLEFLVGLGFIILVSSRGFTWDICHPDNLHVFHALVLFCLCFSALETKRYSLALATFFWAGIGVFTKQTEASSLIGPALVFARYNPWGFRRWIFAAALGAATLALALYLFWMPQYARFYTYELLSRHRIDFGKLFVIYMEFIFAERGLLLFLAVIGGFYLWTASEKGKRYVTTWFTLGIFCVLPNTMAYIKQNGGYNNLILFEVWLALLVWPFALHVFDRLPQPEPDGSAAKGFTFIPGALSVLFVVLVILLFPMRRIPGPDYYQYCQTIEDSVHKDREAGLKVLVSHGTEYLLRAGITNVPLDRCNSILELDDGGMASATGTAGRIRARYYDRIYFLMGMWYGPDIYEDIRQNYTAHGVIHHDIQRSSSPYGQLAYGSQPQLVEDCQVLVPKAASATQNKSQ